MAGKARARWFGWHHEDGGPGRIRTCNQGIHSAPMFPKGVDYLFTRG
jgi:hypothetical protein